MKAIRPSAQQWLWMAAALVVAATLSWGLTHGLSVFQHLEFRTSDLRLSGFSPVSRQDKRIAVVAIDEKSLSQFPYRSPIDREFLALLLLSLEEKGARAIYLDVLLDQATEKEKDDRLLNVISSLKVPLLVAYTETHSVVNEEQLEYLKAFVPQERRAMVNLATDPFDGTVRWLLSGNQRHESVPFKLSRFAFPERSSLLLSAADHERVEINWLRADGDQSVFVRYPAHAVAKLPKEWFADRIVMIGATLSLTDRHRTPFSILFEDDPGMMPGVVALAHQTAQVLDNKRLNKLGLFGDWLVTAVLALIGIGIGLLKRDLFTTVALGVGVIIGFWLWALFGYGWGLPMVPMVAPSMGLAMALFFADLILGRQERRRREFVQSAFSRYVAPALVQRLVDNPEALKVEGEKREMTFIFTDIAGFTTLSETIEPERLSQILNAYLDGMCKQVARFEGTVDKFIGDAVMCIFNAPLEQADHADRAVACALAMDIFSENFRSEMAKEGIKLGMTRIGVHTGSAVVGNFGSQSRMDFTALGDTVNAASRVEGVNKYFGTRLAVTEETRKRVQTDTVCFRPIAHVVLKGKVLPLTLHEAISEDFANSAHCVRYKQAFELLDNNVDLAKEQFAALIKQYPDDSLVRFHQHRIDQGILSATVVMDEK